MKKILIGSIVGGLIIFIWQFISFAAVDLHKPAHQYTDKQGAISSFLNSQGLKEGGYLLPSVPEGTTWSDHDKAMQAAAGKPWMIIEYHQTMDTGMTMNMIRGFLVDGIAVFLLCWIISKMAAPSFGTIFGASLAVGIIAFLFGPYTNSIWYKWADIWAYLADAVVAWGLTGLWLGSYLRRGPTRAKTVAMNETEMEMA